MKSYIVMQQQLYFIQKEKGIIKCPQKERWGNIPHYYSRMTEVEKGDCIFHYQNGHFIAISIANSSASEIFVESNNELHFEISVSYYELQNSLHIRTYWEEIVRLLPNEYSPFQYNGHDNIGYLYPCYDNLSAYLLSKIAELNEDPILFDIIANTEAKITTKMRIGHQSFKRKLMELWQNKCAICGINLSSILKASHAKPWKDCNDYERLDPYNGLLLCAHHDALYDRGFITVDKEGNVLIASILDENSHNIRFDNEEKQISIFEENKKYFQWHKSYVFKK